MNADSTVKSNNYYADVLKGYADNRLGRYTPSEIHVFREAADQIESQAAELAKISAEIYKTARCVSVLDAKTCEIGNSGCPRGLCGPPGISGDGEWNEQIAWLEMIRNVVNGLPQKIDWLTAQLAASQRRERRRWRISRMIVTRAYMLIVHGTNRHVKPASRARC